VSIDDYPLLIGERVRIKSKSVTGSVANLDRRRVQVALDVGPLVWRHRDDVEALAPTVTIQRRREASR